MLGALAELDMAHFTRRHPLLLDTLLRNVLDTLALYESERKELEGDEGAGEESEGMEEKRPGEGEAGGGGGGGGDDGGDAPAGSDAADGGGGGGEGGEGGSGDAQAAAEAALAGAQLSMSPAQSQAPQPHREALSDAQREALRVAAEAANAALAERLAEALKKEWDPVVDKLDAAAQAFEGFQLSDLQEDAQRGFDASAGLWHATGWAELQSLRHKLQRLRELRDLVRNLGRGSGKGPLRRAPRQAERRGAPQGLVRSPEAPEETRGLTRSDDLGRMLPSEATLLAAARGGPDRRPLPAARLLHFARRAERTLLSYERVGWAEAPAATSHGLEVRPAADCGPILLCLDTSGSMMGARETVAKALALECMRQARTQRRACYVYAFSGPRECQEFSLSFSAQGMAHMLSFLSGSFHGGTDVDEPLRRCLARLHERAWAEADILLVTDGEIPEPDAALLADLRAASDTLGLKVHGLLVGEPNSGAVQRLCTQVHTFKAWDAVAETGRP